MIVVSDSYQNVTHYRKLLQLYFAGALRPNNRIRFTLWFISVSEINKREIKLCRFMDKLHGTTLHDAERRSQDFVAVHQIVQTLSQDPNIEWASHAITIHVHRA